MKRSLTIAAATALTMAATSVRAQYPHVPQDVQHAADARKTEADRQSDEVWAKAQDRIKRDAAHGKPFIPSAAKPADLPQADIPAFPGAWGGGMYSFGGRGGRTIVVTSLDDDGPGTLRNALEQSGPRVIVFNVAGVIKLKDRIRVRAPYVTLVGNTAPGDGVCIAGNTVEVETHDVVIRHLRFRRGAMDPGDRNDSLGGNPVGNVMIDHVSASWGLDENLSMYRHMYHPPDGGKDLKLPTVNITIQNSISSEGLNTFNHAFGSTIGGLNSTFHHNLWACNSGRNPSVGMYGDFTFANNVLFNWVHRTVDGGDHMSMFNIINNYLKPGPATPASDVAHRLLKPESERSKTVIDHFGKAYVAGNVVEGDDRVTKDNWDGGVQPAPVKAPLDEVLRQVRVDKPFDHAPLQITDARTAYEFVLNHAGATLPKRDPVDVRVINFVRTGEPTASPADGDAAAFANVGFSKDNQARLVSEIRGGIITNPAQVGGYPEYKGEPYRDSDHDGMPDEWEVKYGLNPNDPSDSTTDLSGDGYTNIEKFIDGIDPTKKTDWRDLKNNVDPLEGAGK
jgi:hypothetical protein